MSFTENSYEVVIIELIKNLGYEYQYGPDIIRDYHLPYINDQLWTSLSNINST